MHGPGVWTADYSWIYISALFAMQYSSGATMFEGNYKPGEWTKWAMKSADNEDERPRFRDRRLTPSSAVTTGPQSADNCASLI